MKKHLRKILSLALALCFLAVPFSVVANAAVPEDNGVMPCLNNTANVLTNMSIDGNGKLSVGYEFSGFPGVTTHANISITIEKKTLGLFWSDTDMEWSTTIYSYEGGGVRNFLLSSAGTYRATVVYTVYGTGGAADVLEYQGTDTYTI